ncbi:hypothetical protein DSBG_1610 [Desulfosporosinus sp. BG]|nr:hypothetical protein DSBG_1610 [Desulfosporosinus sp. BG]
MVGNQLTADIDNYPPLSQIGAMKKTVTRQEGKIYKFFKRDNQ